MTTQFNNHLVLIAGKSATGKSASLFECRNDPGIWYANCENGKDLPFPAKFEQFKITDPLQMYELFSEVENHPEIHTIVIDSMTFLMDMFESLYISTATDTRKAWGDYSAFWNRLMQQYAAVSTKNIQVIGHTSDVMNEREAVMETRVQVKGAIMKKGVESYFTTVVATKKMPVKKLKDYENPLLVITEEEELLGYKHVFQTRLTKDTVHECIRAPMGMWSIKETFIDNNIQHLNQRLNEYYGR